jgi:hypothetical protein
MPQIHLPHLRIVLGHQPARVQGAEPEREAEDCGSEFLRAEYQREGQEAGKHHQFTVATHEKVAAVAGPPNWN